MFSLVLIGREGGGGGGGGFVLDLVCFAGKRWKGFGKGVVLGGSRGNILAIEDFVFWLLLPFRRDLLPP